MMSIREAAKYLGVSEDFIRREAGRGAVKHFQPRKHSMVRFRREWLDDYIEENARGCPAPKQQSRAVRPRRVVTPAADHGF